jgi:hypothetical protein
MPSRPARAALWLVALAVASGVAATIGYARRDRPDPSAVFEPGVCAVSDLGAAGGFRAVPCTNPHDAEVVLTKPWPKGQRLAADDADTECFAELPERTQSSYSALGALPSAITSDSGRLICLLVHPSRSSSIVAEVQG